MTITLTGRTRYADTATTEVTIQRYAYGEAVAVLKGALIEPKGSDGAFTIAAKHESATDEEHDSAYVYVFDGAGLQYDFMNPDGFNAHAVILGAAFYPSDPIPADFGVCDRCSEDHGVLPFMPPKAKWEPATYHIKVRFIAPANPKDFPLAGVSMRRGKGKYGFEPGDRVEQVLLHGKGVRPGYVVDIEEYLSRHERLVVGFDDGETRPINPDVMRRKEEKSG